MSNTPILFLVFNRPDHTARVFEAIRAAKPARLYVAADGPRDAHPKDRNACIEVREITRRVDWPCQVFTLYREQNLGCRKAVSSALNWFFDAEEEGIVLEDDCLPDQSWFPYAAELLARFRGDERICCISGNHFHGERHVPTHSYFASIFNHIWGWASWRRAWRMYDDAMEDWPQLKESKWLIELGQGDRHFAEYWTGKFDACYRGEIDTWDYRWTYSVWRQGAISLLPARNLVLNLGIGEQSTHTRRGWRVLRDWKLETMKFPLSHPADLQIDQWADRWTARHLFRISFLYSLARRVRAALSRADG